MIDASFWNNRAVKYGHTGWSDPSLYLFDQPIRLNVIKEILNDLEIEKKTALDLGTGSGDFAKMLSDVYEKVWAFDVSENVLKIARQNCKLKNNITFLNSTSIINTNAIDSQLDLILSITVLQIYTDNNELSAVLNHLHSLLNKNGIFICLEYTPASSVKKAEHQAERKLEDWVSIFNKNGFELIKRYGFFHPTLKPTLSFSKYYSHPFVKILKLIKRSDFAKKVFSKIAEPFFSNTKEFYWEGKSDDVMSIMIFKKA